MDLTSFGVKKKEEHSNNSLSEITDEKLELNINKIKKDFKQEEIERYLPWFLKYQLKSFDNLILTNEIKKIIDFIENTPKGKGILLHGPAGSGKTTTITLVAKKYNFEIFELNASDARNKGTIEESVGEVIKQKSLFAKNKLILIDEVDGVSGNKDRGGVAQLVKFIKESQYPMTFTANDIDSDKIKALKKQCVLVDFVNHSQELLENIAKRIFKAEKISYKEDEIKKFIKERNTSDIRGFINDLQANVLESKFTLDENLEIRDYKKKIENLMNTIYFSPPEECIKNTYNTDINLDDLFLYLEENTPIVYTKASLIQAFNEIGKADVFKGRIIRWQYWRYLVYINFYLTYGISAYNQNTSKLILKKNQRILKKWIYGNKVNALRSRTKVEKGKGEPQKFIEKLANYYKTSVKKCRSDDLFYFIISYKNDENFRKAMDRKLDIDDATRKTLLTM